MNDRGRQRTRFRGRASYLTSGPARLFLPAAHPLPRRCVGGIFFHSPRSGTSIELRKAITDNGPNGTRRRNRTNVGARGERRSGRGGRKRVEYQPGGGGAAERERAEEKRGTRPRKIRMYRVVIKRQRLPSDLPPAAGGIRAALPSRSAWSFSLSRSSFWTLSRFACGNFPGVIFAALLAPSLTSLSSVYPPSSFFSASARHRDPRSALPLRSSSRRTPPRGPCFFPSRAPLHRPPTCFADRRSIDRKSVV